MVSSAMDFTLKFDWIKDTDFNAGLLKGNETRLLDETCN